MEPALEPLLFALPSDFEAWLAVNHDRNPGVWLRLGKKASKIVVITYAQALEMALCWGWIDSQKKSYDEDTFQQRFSPRKKDSLWSKINREKIDVLDKQGRMQPPGWRVVEQAKANGRWEQAYDGSSRIQVPDDLARLLNDNPEALSFFNSLDATNRYAYLFRVFSKLPGAARERTLIRLVEELKSGKRYH